MVMTPAGRGWWRSGSRERAIKVAHKQQDQHAGCTEELLTKSQGFFHPSTPPCTSNFASVTKETVNRRIVLSRPLIPSYVLHWTEANAKVKVGPWSLLCFWEVGVGDGALTCC